MYQTELQKDYKWVQPYKREKHKPFADWNLYLGIIKKGNNFWPKVVTFTKSHKFKLVTFLNNSQL